MFQHIRKILELKIMEKEEKMQKKKNETSKCKRKKKIKIMQHCCNVSLA